MNSAKASTLKPQMESPEELVSRLPKKPNGEIRSIPGDYGLPVVGHSFQFINDFPKFVKSRVRRYGLVFKTSALMIRTINLLGPEANEFVLKDQEQNFSSKLAWDLVLEKIFPNGLMLRDFDNHWYHRKMLQAAFKKPVMQQYIKHMDAHIGGSVQHWQEGVEFEFWDAIKELLLQVGTEVFFGTKIGEETQQVSQAYNDAVVASTAVFRVPLPGTAWKKGLEARAFLEKYIREMIPERRSSNAGDFFTQVCHAKDENGKQLSDQEIIDHMVFLLFAAHDTTTSTLTSIMACLAQNPLWQERLREEIKLFGQRELDFDNLDQLDKMDWVFKEALRLYPPLPTIPRRAIKDCEFNGFKIPRNTAVGVSPWYTHRMPEYWTQPDKFDPERWSDERAENKKHFYQFVPFGGGRHKCLGLKFADVQSKIFLYHFLQRYEVKVKPGYKAEFQTVPLSMPKDGLKVTIAKV